MKLVKYKSLDGKYENVGLQSESGFIIPIKTIVGRHYYQLLEKATEVKLEYKKKG